MKNDPSSSTNPANPDRDTPQGTTETAQGETQQPVPRRQYERDQSADSQVADNPSMGTIGRIARKDAERGIPDTTKAKELDETYQRQKPDDER